MKTVDEDLFDGANIGNVVNFWTIIVYILIVKLLYNWIIVFICSLYCELRLNLLTVDIQFIIS